MLAKNVNTKFCKKVNFKNEEYYVPAGKLKEKNMNTIIFLHP
jgi:hypothetical protein